MFQLVLLKNDGKKSWDITPMTKTITWDSNLSLMAAMEFELIQSDISKYFPKNPCDLGDVVMLMKDGKEVYRGIIVTEGRAGRENVKYTVYDYAWYLGKSKSLYQFNRIPVSQAITKIVKDFGMLIGKIPTMNTIIDQIYLEKSPAEIIQDMYKRHEKASGKRYNVEMRQGKIYFEDMKELVIKGTFQLAGNIGKQAVMDAPLGANRTRSIEKMRNKINILIERDKADKGKPKYEVAATSQKKEWITKYGLLEDTYKIDAEDVAKAREVARILLQRLARIHETNSLKLIGDVVFKAGRLLDVIEPITGIKGRYMILSVKHTVSNQVHVMDVELVRPEEVK